MYIGDSHHRSINTFTITLAINVQSTVSNYQSYINGQMKSTYGALFVYAFTNQVDIAKTCDLSVFIDIVIRVVKCSGPRQRPWNQVTVKGMKTATSLLLWFRKREALHRQAVSFSCDFIAFLILWTVVICRKAVLIS